MLATMRIALELIAAEGDRLEGHVTSEDGRFDLEFSGTLDLLRAIEELRHIGEEPSPCC
jgi:hypothetical protein